jgi:hypothetical protein
MVGAIALTIVCKLNLPFKKMELAEPICRLLPMILESHRTVVMIIAWCTVLLKILMQAKLLEYLLAG